MKLEEVKERLLELARISEEGAKLHPEDSEMFLTDKEALDTAVAELHAMQNLLDEKNAELDRLQKENEELKCEIEHLNEYMDYKTEVYQEILEDKQNYIDLLKEE